MKKLIVLAAVVIAYSCNGPKDPPDDDSGAKLTPSGILVDTTKIPTTEMLQRKIDSIGAVINSKN